MGNISELTVQQVLDLVDEFQSIKLNDKIQKGDEVFTVYGLGLETEFQQKSISFIQNDAVVSINRDEYVLQGWRKVNNQS